ncbi:putative protein mesa [Diplodia seriata]|uniref:Arf3-interacting protein 1 N-terminal domain-containing protein n=1 Tax=Diplodia seriata TaxID=420778 RepID=A0A0G2ELQ6_9PEZI|nr:putative protein mesa [Diplodia seriata]
MGRPLRSQYPSNSRENHVEYILVASFDIDRGSIMEHQYPGPISGDEHMLADLMLPDQAHVRSQDWTIFFLHKDTEAEEEAKEERRERRRLRSERKAKKAANGAANGENGTASEEEEEDDDDDLDSEDSEESDDEGFEGPPLIYVLNLVNTKQDNTVKSNGNLHKTQFPAHLQGNNVFRFPISKPSTLIRSQPLLLLAIEEYFRNPEPETLASLYDSLNSMDLSLLPRLSFLERNILQASTAPDMFIEKFEQMVAQRQIEDMEDTQLALSKTTSGSPTRAPANRYTLPRDTHEFESRVMYNGVPVPIKVPTAIQPETVGDFSLIKLIQTMNMPSTNGKDIDPTGDTQFMEAILGAISNRLGEGAIRSRFRDWVLKFTRLAAASEETVYGASALHIGAQSAASALSPTSPEAEFSPVDANIKGHGYVWATEAERLRELGANVHRVEGWRNTRSYYSYVQDLARMWERQPIRHLDLLWLHDRLRATRLTHEQSAGVYLALARAVEEAGKPKPSDEKEDASNKDTSIAAILNGKGDKDVSANDDDDAASGGGSPVSPTANAPPLAPDRRLSPISAAAQRQYDTILQLLSVTPESNSGLFHLSLGLFHPRQDVRQAVVALLEKVMDHPAGRHFWASLGRFAKLALYRIKREQEAVSTPGLL